MVWTRRKKIAAGLFGGTALLGLLVWLFRRSGRMKAMGSWGFIYPQVHDATSASEIEALARMLLVESRGFAQPMRETGQIGHAAINRAREYGATVHDVVYGQIKPPKYPRARQVWNAGAAWDNFMKRASGSPRWEEAKVFAERLLRGEIPNEIGQRTQFVHYKTQLRLGRKIPTWAVAKSEGGQARFDPVDIEEARFS